MEDRMSQDSGNTDRWAGRKMDGGADGCTEKWMEGQVDAQKNGWMDRWTGRQAGRQAGRQTDGRKTDQGRTFVNEMPVFNIIITAALTV